MSAPKGNISVDPSHRFPRPNSVASRLPRHRIVLDLPDGSLWGWTFDPPPEPRMHVRCFTSGERWVVYLETPAGKPAILPDCHVPRDVFDALASEVSMRRAELHDLWLRDRESKP